MKAPELALSPKASRCVPGVNVPVAAPNWALEPTSAPRARNERPCAVGNMPTRGCSAAASSATAGGGAAAVVLEAVVLAAVVLGAAAVPDDEEDDEADPHPAMSRARTGGSKRAQGSLMAR